MKAVMMLVASGMVMTAAVQASQHEIWDYDALPGTVNSNMPYKAQEVPAVAVTLEPWDYDSLAWATRPVTDVLALTGQAPVQNVHLPVWDYDALPGTPHSNLP